jgi:UDP-N-acetylglucosamine acyltransferase
MEDGSFIAGMGGVHQFCRVGRLAFIGAGSIVVKDVPPFTTVQGDRARLVGLNLEGIKRKGFTAQQISSLKKAYRLLFRSGLILEEAVERVKVQIPDDPNIGILSDFLLQSQRGVTR